MSRPKAAAPLPWLKVAAVLTVIGGLAVGYRLGVFDQLGDPARLARSLVELGAWGYIGFVVAYALFQPFGVPGTIFIVAAPLIWPWPVAFALSMVGTMAASTIGFAFARLVARDWVSARIPMRFRKYDDALAARAFATVFLLRLVFWMPPLLHAFFGVSKVRFATHFWASFAGYLLPVFLVSFFGQRAFDMLKQASGEWRWLAAIVTVAMLALVAWFVRSRRARGAVT